MVMYQGAGFRQLPQTRPTSQVPLSSIPGKLAPFSSLSVVKSRTEPETDVGAVGRGRDAVEIEELRLELGGGLRVVTDDGARDIAVWKSAPSAFVVICDQSSVSAGVPPGTPVIVRLCRFAV